MTTPARAAASAARSAAAATSDSESAGVGDVVVDLVVVVVGCVGDVVVDLVVVVVGSPPPDEEHSHHPSLPRSQQPHVPHGATRSLPELA